MRTYIVFDDFKNLLLGTSKRAWEKACDRGEGVPYVRITERGPRFYEKAAIIDFIRKKFGPFNEEIAE